MISRLLSVLPLIFFVALVLWAGFFIVQGLTTPPTVARSLTDTPTPNPTPTQTQTPSPTSTATPPFTPTPSPTSTATPALPATPTPSPQVTSIATPIPFPTPTPTARPVTLVWVQTNNLADSPHTLALSSPEAENPVLQQYAVAPALSPDSKKLVFFLESSLSGLNTGIWVADIIGGLVENYRRLTDATDVQNIVWSPDGDKLAFEVVLNPSNPIAEWQSQVRIIRSDPAGGYVELNRFDGRHPAWSPNGERLVYYACQGSNCGLFIANCTGGACDPVNAEQVTFDSTDGYPTWSVDGNIAFASNRDGNHEIYLLRLESGELQNLTARPSIDTTPVFSPDGQTLYFRTDLDGVWQIQTISLNNDRTVREINTLLSDVGGDEREWGLLRPVVR